MSQDTAKRAFGIVSKVFSWIIIVVTVLMVIFTLFSTLTFDRNDRILFGIRFYIVLTDSMSLSENNKDDKIHFDAGDIVMIKTVKNKYDLEEGDIIAFISQNSDSFGETITHRIRTVRRNDRDLVIGYVTYGTNTGTDDEALVEPDYILGKYEGHLPKVGTFFQFLKTPRGYLICILLPFLLLIGWQGSGTIRLFKKYKKEQADAIEAEKAEIAAERKQNEDMMKELLALKAQLGLQTPPATPAANAEDTANAASDSAAADAENKEAPTENTEEPKE